MQIICDVHVQRKAQLARCVSKSKGRHAVQSAERYKINVKTQRAHAPVPPCVEAELPGSARMVPCGPRHG